MNASHDRSKRRGFTLVELLVVLTIIGILAGIAIPGISAILNRANVAGIRAEVEGLNQAVEAYKTKYGDYPPDFSSWPVVQSHYRKIFPDIALSELTLLYRLCDTEPDTNVATQTGPTITTIYNPSGMDRAECLVWSLGGFSSDPQLPFTGAGGPLALMPTVPNDPTNPVNPAVWQYNTTRDNSLLDIDAARLTLASPDSSIPISITNRVESNDEEGLTAPLTTATVPNDLFPAYRNDDDHAPYVYFDSRTYRYFVPNTALFNGYVTTIDGELDVARPCYSERVNAKWPVPSATGGTYATIPNALQAWEFMNPQSFQILSPGVDGRYGPIGDFDGNDPTDTPPAYYQYPTGKLVIGDASKDNPQALLDPQVDRYDLGNKFTSYLEVYQKDNMGNFVDSTFEDDLP